MPDFLDVIGLNPTADPATPPPTPGCPGASVVAFVPAADPATLPAGASYAFDTAGVDIRVGDLLYAVARGPMEEDAVEGWRPGAKHSTDVWCRYATEADVGAARLALTWASGVVSEPNRGALAVLRSTRGSWGWSFGANAFEYAGGVVTFSAGRAYDRAPHGAAVVFGFTPAPVTAVEAPDGFVALGHGSAPGGGGFFAFGRSDQEGGDGYARDLVDAKVTTAEDPFGGSVQMLYFVPEALDSAVETPVVRAANWDADFPTVSFSADVRWGRSLFVQGVAEWTNAQVGDELVFIILGNWNDSSYGTGEWHCVSYGAQLGGWWVNVYRKTLTAHDLFAEVEGYLPGLRVPVPPDATSWYTYDLYAISGAADYGFAVSEAWAGFFNPLASGLDATVDADGVAFHGGRAWHNTLRPRFPKGTLQLAMYHALGGGDPSEATGPEGWTTVDASTTGVLRSAIYSRVLDAPSETIEAPAFTLPGPGATAAVTTLLAVYPRAERQAKGKRIKFRGHGAETAQTWGDGDRPHARLGWSYDIGAEAGDLGVVIVSSSAEDPGEENDPAGEDGWTLAAETPYITTWDETTPWTVRVYHKILTAEDIAGPDVEVNKGTHFYSGVNSMNTMVKFMAWQNAAWGDFRFADDVELVTGLNYATVNFGSESTVEVPDGGAQVIGMLLPDTHRPFPAAPISDWVPEDTYYGPTLRRVAQEVSVSLHNFIVAVYERRFDAGSYSVGDSVTLSIAGRDTYPVTVPGPEITVVAQALAASYDGSVASFAPISGLEIGDLLVVTATSRAYHDTTPYPWVQLNYGQLPGGADAVYQTTACRPATSADVANGFTFRAEGAPGGEPGVAARVVVLRGAPGSFGPTGIGYSTYSDFVRGEDGVLAYDPTYDWPISAAGTPHEGDLVLTLFTSNGAINAMALTDGVPFTDLGGATAGGMGFRAAAHWITPGDIATDYLAQPTMTADAPDSLGVHYLTLYFHRAAPRTYQPNPGAAAFLLSIGPADPESPCAGPVTPPPPPPVLPTDPLDGINVAAFSWANMPQGWRDAGGLGRDVHEALVGGFQDARDTLDALPATLNPAASNPDALRWAAFVARIPLAVADALPTGLLRRLVPHAGELGKWRGTLRAILLLRDLFFPTFAAFRLARPWRFTDEDARRHTEDGYWGVEVEPGSVRVADLGRVWLAWWRGYVHAQFRLVFGALTTRKDGATPGYTSMVHANYAEYTQNGSVYTLTAGGVSNDEGSQLGTAWRFPATTPRDD